jgi:Helicase HerA, central domain
VTEDELLALTAVQFNWAVSPEDVWSPLAFHVGALHANVATAITARLKEADRGRKPIGVVLEGGRGVGKTHMLRWARQEVQQGGGYFFLIKFLEGAEFWHSVLHSVVSGFYAGQGDQLTRALRALCDITEIDNLRRTRISGLIPISREDVDAFVDSFAAINRQVWIECDDTARALALYPARGEAGEVGRSYFDLDGELTDEQRAAWGFRRSGRLPQEILSDLARLLALTGPTVLAVDQLDQLLVQSLSTADGSGEVPLHLVNQVAGGLMELRELMPRTLTVIACLPTTWQRIRRSGVQTAADRFVRVQMGDELPGSEVAEMLVGRHLASLYGDAGYTAPYPTWPVLPQAFRGADVSRYTPRRLLMQVADHIHSCLESGELVELESFDGQRAVPPPLPVEEAALTDLDRRFAEYRLAADVLAPLAPETEDALVPRLLSAGLRAYIYEFGDRGRSALALDPPPGAKPQLHARLRLTLDEPTEDEVHWGFRAIAAEHHLAVQSRFRGARTEAGLRTGSEKRNLVVLRGKPLSRGPKTQQMLADFQNDSGVLAALSEEDIRTFAALERLLDRYDPALLQWLAARRPASSSELFGRVLPVERIDALLPGGPVGMTTPAMVSSGSPSDEVHAAADTELVVNGASDGRPLVPTGRSERSGHQTVVLLETLRKHTVVFAGSGSGKTVLLRRLIEECALHGVSSIVLDPNNDLARLGDAWPQPPSGWGPGDAEKAKDYMANTEVVVWTPRKDRGRPLVLRPLPDFRDVLDDDEELGLAVEAAVAGLLPRVKLTAKNARVGTAVLQQTLGYFAQGGGGELRDFVEVLADLPESVPGLETLPRARKLAAEMSEELAAAMLVDPLFGGAGTPLDPGVLLTPGPGYRARVSVVSFVGLPADQQRQTFVNQLQMALFAWIKKNPAGDRPLGGLLVMDEAQDFAPSGAATACTESTLQLSAQARKYGLGLMFATQAPKGLHNRIPGNATTQFFGLLNSGVQINAATELARRKGGQVDDIARLSSGIFYAASEGVGFEKVRMPMCLSHHPSSALTQEEVLKRARGEEG